MAMRQDTSYSSSKLGNILAFASSTAVSNSTNCSWQGATWATKMTGLIYWFLSAQHNWFAFPFRHSSLFAMNSWPRSPVGAWCVHWDVRIAWPNLECGKPQPPPCDDRQIRRNQWQYHLDNSDSCLHLKLWLWKDWPIRNHQPKRRHDVSILQQIAGQRKTGNVRKKHHRIGSKKLFKKELKLVKGECVTNLQNYWKEFITMSLTLWNSQLQTNIPRIFFSISSELPCESSHPLKVTNRLTDFSGRFFVISKRREDRSWFRTAKDFRSLAIQSSAHCSNFWFTSRTSGVKILELELNREPSRKHMKRMKR